MEYADYLLTLREHAAGLTWAEYGEVQERGRTYPLVRLTSPGRQELVVTSGFHGEERAGPLTLATRLPEVLRWARDRDVGLRVYPCINPSGFELGTRYNASGERPNNDFLRYEVAPGVVQGELARGGEPVLRWFPYDGGPQETRALRAELERSATPHAALDIHQDAGLPAGITYAYVFGPREAYLPMMQKAEAHARVVRCEQVDDFTRTDGDGMIEFHDGSVTDYFFRRGVRYTAALETTTATPLDACHAINLIWIQGFVELARR